MDNAQSNKHIEGVLNEKRNPWMKWYPSDWRADTALRMCSLTARGLWIEMIGMMHEAETYGHLYVAGKPPTDAQLASLVGASVKEVSRLMAELEEAGVFSRTDNGVVYSRRMLRDKAKAAKDQANGKRGGNPRVKQGVNPPDNQEVDGADKAQKPEARSQKLEKESKPPPASRSPSRKTAMPNNFAISDRVRAWAKEKGYSQLEAHFENFVGKVKAKGYAYIDWDEAFMGAIRDNWAKLTPVAPAGPKKLTVHDRADLDFEKKYGTAESLGNLMKKLGVSHA